MPKRTAFNVVPGYLKLFFAAKQLLPKKCKWNQFILTIDLINLLTPLEKCIYAQYTWTKRFIPCQERKQHKGVQQGTRYCS